MTLLVLAGCHSASSGSAALDRGAEAGPQAAPAASHVGAADNGQTSLETTGAVTARIVLTGTQVGRREAQYIRFTWSQSNDKALGGPDRQTFSLQTGTRPEVGQPVQGVGNLQLGTTIYSGPCMLTLSGDSPLGTRANARLVKGAFECERMRDRDNGPGEIKVSNGLLSGVVIGGLGS